MKTKILLTALLTFILFTSDFSQELDKAKLDRFFDRLSEKNKAMGSLTITREGKVLYSRSVGYSRIEDSEMVPLKETSGFRIGSISKMFTATMILQLVEEGKLKLTDTLSNFFPQVPGSGKITILQMLGHRSGIFDLTDTDNFRSWKTEPKTQDEMISIISEKAPVFEPDTKVSYSNSNYLLLGFIIEKLTGKTFQEALNGRITSKLGLNNTYRGTGKTEADKNESFSFRFIDNWEKESETHLSIPGGAGAIISNPMDLTRFIQALFDLKLTSQKSLSSMKDIKEKYGLGMVKYQIGDKTFYGHGGGIDGFRSILLYQPEEKLAIAYTSNAVVYPLISIIEGVIDIYMNKPFQIPEFETIELSRETMDKYTGVYSPGSEAPAKFTVTIDSAKLYIQMTGQNALPLEPLGQNKFQIESAGILIEFITEKKQIVIIRNGRQRILTKED